MPRFLGFISFAILSLAFVQEMPTSILELTKGTSEHTFLVAALYKANLVQTLSIDNPITIFAPNDEAFRNLGTSSELLDDPRLTELLQDHMVPGVWTAAQIIAGIDADGGLSTMKTLNGKDLTLTVVDGNIVLNDKVIFVTPDLEAQDGIIHVIDSVLSE